MWKHWISSCFQPNIWCTRYGGNVHRIRCGAPHLQSCTIWNTSMKEKGIDRRISNALCWTDKSLCGIFILAESGKHTRDKNHRSPNNGTCNAYLRDVFRFYLFIEEEYQQFGELKVLSYNYFVAVDAVGVKKSIRSKSFKGYLKEEEHKARAAKKDEIVEILKALYQYKRSASHAASGRDRLPNRWDIRNWLQ